MKNAQNWEGTSIELIKECHSRIYRWPRLPLPRWLKIERVWFRPKKRETSLRYRWYFVGKPSKTSCENANTYLLPILNQTTHGGSFLKTDVLGVQLLIFWFDTLMSAICWHTCVNFNVNFKLFYVLKDVMFYVTSQCS